MQKQASESKQLPSHPSTTQIKTPLQTIQQTKSHLDGLIEQLNVKLHSHFHKKQAELIEQYKLELIAAQKQLNELKANTNEEQIKNKMIERKKELEKERFELIQTNMFFSNKCEDYKRKLALLVAEGKQLQKELLFLDGQINNAYKKKYQIIQQQDGGLNQQQQTPQVLPAIVQNKTNTLPLFSDRKQAQKIDREKPSPGNKLASSVSVRDTTSKKAIIEESLNSKVKKNILRSTQRVPTKQIEKTALEQLFQGTVEQIRSRRKGKKVGGVRGGQQFSEYQKKQIMQEFLSREQVKRKIYQIIFQSEEKRPMLPGSFQPESAKIKISFQDIN